MSYVSVPIDTDPAALTQDVFDYLEALVPGWLASDGNMDVRIISAMARVAAESRDVASDVPTTIFRYFGQNLVGVPPLDGTAATLSLTFTARDNVGYTIPAGTLVQGTDASGNTTYWSTVFDNVIAPGNTSIAGCLAAIDTDGVAYNGLVFSTGQLTLVDSLAFISTVAAVGASSGGVDAEDDASYLNRLSRQLRLLAPRPITADDFAILSQDQEGISRAIAIDGYDATANTFSNARTVTVFALAADGSTPPSPVLTSAQVTLTALREANFVVYVVGPTHSNIRTTYTVIAEAGYDHTLLKASIDAAIAIYLDPSTWGSPDVGDATAWVNKPYVRISELSAAIQDVEGVDSVTVCQISSVAADYDMTNAGANGPVAVPSWNSGSSVGTVT